MGELEPWKIKDESKAALRDSILRLLLEAVYVLSHFFAPFVPTAADAIFKKLCKPAMAIPDLSDSFMNLTTGAEVTSESVLFQQFDVQAVTTKSSAPSAPASAEKAETK